MKFFAAVCAALIAAYAYQQFFPSEEELIKRRAHALAALLEKEKNENVLAAASRIGSALQFFDKEVIVTAVGYKKMKKRIVRDDKKIIQQVITQMRFVRTWLLVEVENFTATVDSSKMTANSEFNVNLKFETTEQGKVYDPYDLKVGWVKKADEWLINSVWVRRSGDAGADGADGENDTDGNGQKESKAETTSKTKISRPPAA